MSTRLSDDDKARINASKATFVYSEDGKRLLKVNETCGSEVTIPEGTEVICNKAFQGNSSVKKVFLPTTLRLIGDNAFQECANLVYINIPELVEMIPNGCFNKCTNLENVYLHNGITHIMDSAFAYCEALRKISFPSKLHIIDKFAFTHSGLEVFNPTIQDGVECWIFDRAFAFCENLKTVVLTPGVIIKEPMSFICCQNLEEVIFTGKKHGDQTAIGTMLLDCDNLKKITVPESKFGGYDFNSKNYDVETAQYGPSDYNHLVVTI